MSAEYILETGDYIDLSSPVAKAYPFPIRYFPYP